MPPCCGARCQKRTHRLVVVHSSCCRPLSTETAGGAPTLRAHLLQSEPPEHSQQNDSIGQRTGLQLWKVTTKHALCDIIRTVREQTALHLYRLVPFITTLGCIDRRWLAIAPRYSRTLHLRILQCQEQLNAKCCPPETPYSISMFHR